MTFRYVLRRDLDGTWSVRNQETKSLTVYRSIKLVGLTEKAAAMHAKRLNTGLANAEAAPLPRQ